MVILVIVNKSDFVYNLLSAEIRSGNFYNMTQIKEKLRQEYPRPQFFRQEWINLNGEWSFEFDWSKTGIERGLASSKGVGAHHQRAVLPGKPAFRRRLYGFHRSDVLSP